MVEWSGVEVSAWQAKKLLLELVYREINVDSFGERCKVVMLRSLWQASRQVAKNVWLLLAACLLVFALHICWCVVVTLRLHCERFVSLYARYDNCECVLYVYVCMCVWKGIRMCELWIRIASVRMGMRDSHENENRNINIFIYIYGSWHGRWAYAFQLHVSLCVFVCMVAKYSRTMCASAR